MNVDHAIQFKWPATTFYRLLIPEIFANLNKVIYLDIDTLIHKDLSDLYNVEFSEYIAGVKDPIISKWISSNNKCIRDGIPKERLEYKNFEDGSNDFDVHIQAGVLVFNISKWKNVDLKAFFDIAIELNMNDQDLINYVFRKDMFELNPKYSLSLHVYFNNNIDDLFNKTNTSSIDEAFAFYKNAHIIHFSLRAKPDYVVNKTSIDLIDKCGGYDNFLSLLKNYSPEDFDNNRELIYKMRIMSHTYHEIIKMCKYKEFYEFAFDEWFKYYLDLSKNINLDW